MWINKLLTYLPVLKRSDGNIIKINASCTCAKKRDLENYETHLDIIMYYIYIIYESPVTFLQSPSWGLLLCIGQIEASTSPPHPRGIPRAFDTFAVPGRREFDYQSLPGGGEFDPHALGVGNLNCTLDFM